MSARGGSDLEGPVDDHGTGARRLWLRSLTHSAARFFLAVTAMLALLGWAAGGTSGGDAAAQPPDQTGRRPVWVAEVRGVIDPPVAQGVTRLIAEAEKGRVAAMVFALDTPGGLDESMRQIIQAELASTVPVVFFVFPEGARAASAGVYILMGADVAAMAPQTNLGAATPVSLTGQMDDTMRRKVTNDAAAYIRALAQQHGRNADWGEKAVRQAVSLSAPDAKAQRVIDVVATDVDDLLRQLDGMTTSPKGLTLQTADAPIRTVGLSWVERFLHAVVNPNVAFILMLLGVFGLIFELQSPGVGLGGVTGAIALLLALYAFQVLPVNLVGVGLILVAVILFIGEAHVTGGLLGVGGAVALVLGGLLLVDAPIPSLRVHWVVVALGAAASLAFVAVVLRSIRLARRSRPTTGAEGLIGARGVARSPLEPRGKVFVRGELWEATAEEPVRAGAEVEVVGVEGLLLRVQERPVPEAGVGRTEGRETERPTS